jgi:hypothetical protein
MNNRDAAKMLKAQALKVHGIALKAGMVQCLQDDQENVNCDRELTEEECQSIAGGSATAELADAFPSLIAHVNEYFPVVVTRT